MILYNAKVEGLSLRVTKFDDDLNVESSYLVTETNCECPQGHKPTCRHRKMRQALLSIADTEEFYCFDNAMYYGMEGQGYKTPKARAGLQVIDEAGPVDWPKALNDEVAPASTPMAHVLYKTGDADAPDVIKDRNGEVVLGLCRICGRGEIKLDEPCTPPDLPSKLLLEPEPERIRRRI